MMNYFMVNSSRVSARIEEFNSIMSNFTGWYYNNGTVHVKSCDLYEVKYRLSMNDFM